MDRQQFEQTFKGRYKYKDQVLIDTLWNEFGSDFEKAEDKEEVNECFELIERSLDFYKLGKSSVFSSESKLERSEPERVSRQQQAQPYSPSLSEKNRSDAVSEYIAKVASADALTVKYRECVLGQTFTTAQANEFLLSPVSSWATVWIGAKREPRDISFLRYEFGNEDYDEDGPFRMLRYTFVGRDTQIKLRPILQLLGRGDGAFVYPGETVSPDGQWRRVPTQRSVDEVLIPIASDTLVVAAGQSAIGRLEEYAHKLARKYFLEIEDAVQLILTGKEPRPSYMSAKIQILENESLSRASLELLIDPWIPPEAVKSYYKEIRDQIMHSSGSIHDCTLSVFRFVTSHTEVERHRLKLPNLKRLSELWNEKYPAQHKWHFADYRGFYKAYHRGRASVAFSVDR